MNYFVTVHYRDDKNIRNSGSRCWGYQETFEEALRSVLIDETHMQECLYQWICIEAIPPGIARQAEIVYWGKYNYDKMCWEKCEEPEWAVGTCNFGIG
jgi:hypothetical protein